LSPWWLRPTAEGTQEQDDNKQQQRSTREPAAAYEPPPAESTPGPAVSFESAMMEEEPPTSQGTEPEPEPAWRYPEEEPVAARAEAATLPSEERAVEDEGALEEDDELEADGEGEGEAQAGEAGEESPRRKRPRRGRRRKNGRSATAETAADAADTAEDDDEDEAFHEEPAEEPAAAPAPLPPLTLRRDRDRSERPERPERPERLERTERLERERPERLERKAERMERVVEREERLPAAAAFAPAQASRAARASEPMMPAYTPASDLERLAREIIITVPDPQRRSNDERKIAMFCDFENIALGVRDSEIGKFDITLILERLLEKGKIIVKKAYADWERYSDYKRPFHEAAIELIDIPQKYYSGKNSADIKMVVDAMDLSYSKEHLDTFVILSGDSDFSPLVSKLKENNKYVIGVGVKNSSSNLLIDNCDEFIYYEDVWRDTQKGPKLDGLNKKTAEVFSLLVESIQALLRENKEVLWGSMIKQTMQRKKPSFNEGYYGYSTFSELLEDAERKTIIKLKKDQRSGTYIVTGFAKSGSEQVAAGRR
jgi:uncharacterized protein (TIGR00288 family)